MRRKYCLLLLLLLMLACQVIPTPPPLTPTPLRGETPQPSTPSPVVTTGGTPQDASPSPSPTPADAATSAPGELFSFTFQALGKFAAVEMSSWQPVPYTGVDFPLPVDLEKITNLPVAAGLTNSQRAFLVQNGFVVMHSQEAQFGDIRERVGKIYGQPYYLTTDVAYHTLHLTFDELLKALEREELRQRMIAVTQGTLEEVVSYIPLVQGTSIQADTELAAAYLGVALRLFDPQAPLDPRLEATVMAQVEQIMAGEGRDYSVLIPDFEDDYGAYKPVGHYAGDTELETYFRGMTWLGRVHFPLEDTNPTFIPSRAPLIITMAVRRAQVEGRLAAEEWAVVNDVLTFLVGPSDDAGPKEYATLMDQVYGEGYTIISLADETTWDAFLGLSQTLPTPRINSIFVDSLADMEEALGWRFMGQRFSLDAFVLQNLVFDKVGTFEEPRELPSGLDVMAALGSSVAMEVLEEVGATDYLYYREQMAQMQAAVSSQEEPQWLNTAYGSWLYAFLPQLEAKEADYPGYMRTSAWAYKDLNSALGSWAELKHDTTLYVKMPEMAGGGGPPSSGPAPGYVEPNPLVYYRLAYLASTTAEGLIQRGMGMMGEISSEPLNLRSLISGMQDLAEDMRWLGDIAVKELAGIPLEESDYWLIQGALGPVEKLVLYSQQMSAHGVGEAQEMPPVPVISAVAGAGDRVLQAGVGLVDRIYVVVPLDGELQIMQGGVFSYYEFPQPRSDRLTDDLWRQLLSSDTTPALPGWAANFVLPGGNPVDYLAFRVGDVYLITRAGADLNVREEPSRDSEVLRRMKEGDYVMIVDGPVEAEGFIWWKLNLDLNAENPLEGWAVENPEWYERAWGQ